MPHDVAHLQMFDHRVHYHSLHFIIATFLWRTALNPHTVGLHVPVSNSLALSPYKEQDLDHTFFHSKWNFPSSMSLFSVAIAINRRSYETDKGTRRNIISEDISSLADFLRCFGIIIIIIHQPKVPRGVILSVKISRAVDILRCFDIALLCYAVLCWTQDIEFMWAKHQIW